MPINVVTKSGVLKDDTAMVPSLGDLMEKADKLAVEAIEIRLGKKAERVALDKIKSDQSEIGRRLTGKIDRAELKEFFAQLTGAVENGAWRQAFVQFLETHKKRLETALQAEHQKAVRHVEILRRETAALQSLRGSLREAADDHKRDVVALFDAMVQKLSQESAAISSIHQACDTMRNDMRKSLQEAQALASTQERALKEAQACADLAARRVGDDSGRIVEVLNRARSDCEETQARAAQCLALADQGREAATQAATQLNLQIEDGNRSFEKVYQDSIAALNLEFAVMREEAINLQQKLDIAHHVGSTFGGRLKWILFGSPGAKA